MSKRNGSQNVAVADFEEVNIDEINATFDVDIEDAEIEADLNSQEQSQDQTTDVDTTDTNAQDQDQGQDQGKGKDKSIPLNIVAVIYSSITTISLLNIRISYFLPAM